MTLGASRLSHTNVFNATQGFKQLCSPFFLLSYLFPSSPLSHATERPRRHRSVRRCREALFGHHSARNLVLPWNRVDLVFIISIALYRV
jgi:hypothetical protein